MEQAIAARMKQVSLGPAAGFENLTVFPLVGDGPRRPDYLTLDEALQQHVVEIGEVSEGGSVPHIQVCNKAPKPVLLVDGEELIGAKQNRIVNLTILVPARRALVIPVSCVEAGRWHHAAAHFAAAPRTQYAKARAEKVRAVNASMQCEGSRQADQQAIWEDIAAKSSRMMACSETGAMSEIFERHAAPIDAYVDAIPAGERRPGASRPGGVRPRLPPVSRTSVPPHPSFSKMGPHPQEAFMRRRLIVGFGLAALVVMPAAAQTVDHIMTKSLAALVVMPAAQQTVDDIIAKNNDAKGGLARQKAVQSVRMTGRMTVGPGIEAPIVLEMKRPKSMRIDIAIQGMTITQAYDGTVGWALNPLSGRTDPEALPAEQLKIMDEQADMDGPLIDYKAKGSTVELLGKEKAEGTECYKIKVTLKNGDVRTFFIDAESYLDVKVESRTMVRGTEQLGDTIVGDWKEVGGILMAHSIDSGQPGAPARQKMTIDKIELNVPLDASRFAMPVKK